MIPITLTPDAVEDLRQFTKPDRRKILRVLESQLHHEPAVETQNRKRLRPNKLAEWELRAGRFRIFFDMDKAEPLIRVVAVGYKEGSRLFIRGKEYAL
jgi:mRNA-degrading endonuclease RelE of RelBE toxin-antitoxin system